MNVLIVGTYTTRDAPAIAGDQELGRGIYLFPYDGESGEAGEAAVIAEAENPSWVCVAGGRMFAVSERADSAVLLEYELCKSGQEEVCDRRASYEGKRVLPYREGRKEAKIVSVRLRKRRSESD